NPSIATALESNRYVALGDSVAAGAGLPPGVGITEEQGCARSEQAYPYKVAASLGMSLEHLACSGAKVDEGLYGPQEVNGTAIEAQLDRAFAAGTPDLITVTIGANDARWSQFVSDCYTWRCGSHWDDARISAYLLDLRWELYLTLTNIQQRSDGTMPKVLFTGYFTPLSLAAPNCNDTRNITTDEITWLNTQVAALNQQISDAVSWYGFATYVPIDFSGHELCTANSWIQGVQDPAPFHPTAAGQTAMARAILAAE
ncbi:MAG: SGNH/GDSL hydrolase family protein, partial [Patescibacteria group bacterium]